MCLFVRDEFENNKLSILLYIFLLETSSYSLDSGSEMNNRSIFWITICVVVSDQTWFDQSRIGTKTAKQQNYHFILIEMTVAKTILYEVNVKTTQLSDTKKEKEREARFFSSN